MAADRTMADLVLRAPEPRDVSSLTAMTNLPGVRAGTHRLPFASEAEVARRFLERPADQFAIVAATREAVVGWAFLERGRGRKAHSAGFGLAVHDDHWGEGIGAALLGAALDMADGWLGLVRVHLDVLADNHRAIALYERFGFETEGRLRADVLRDGVLVDSLVMARLRSAPAPAGEA
ncbi:GNAT family N-acetyltransferase [Acuticoccus sp. M5D2P5]|uniref:GNAT family N-acetyltransferase n=1 Tax=Acuticoccus kalidii TaxID=2910977 RepID=UPI001F1D8996|nr:GNAT family N-acetyltransferase [Acuticoccus kalidii]MCF3933558.1 GNAT family N-acetyltransferase [Acuticoccus kalidii]